MRETDELPRCADCGGSRFRRDSIFSARQDHECATAELPLFGHLSPPGWIEQVRRALPRPGNHLAYRDGERTETFAIARSWTRIGRGDGADVRLDDPTVSRRHALILAEPGKPLQVLDDRSLNGVLVNGKRVELAAIGDGDELAIGRFRLSLLVS